MTSRASRALRLGFGAVLLTFVTSLNSCAGGHQLHPEPLVLDPVMPPVAWFRPELQRDVSDLSRWRRSVGPPVILAGASGAAVADRLIVVNWNVHVGGGDISRLHADLRAAEPGAAIVFLLQ